MNINDVYALPAISSTFNINVFMGSHIGIFPELAVVGSFNKKTQSNLLEKNKKLEARIVKEFYGGYQRYNDTEAWLIVSLWYDGDPFMVVRNVAREGDTYPNYFISDLDTYHNALYFLYNLMETDDDMSNERWLPLSGGITGEPAVINHIEVSNGDERFEAAIAHSLRYGPLVV